MHRSAFTLGVLALMLGGCSGSASTSIEQETAERHALLSSMQNHPSMAQTSGKRPQLAGIDYSVPGATLRSDSAGRHPAAHAPAHAH